MRDAAIRLHPGVGIWAWHIVSLDVDRVAEEGVWGPNVVLDIPLEGTLQHFILMSFRQMF